MRKTILFVFALVLTLTVAGASHAVTLQFPAKQPVLTITFPDNWQVKPDPEYDKGIVVYAPDNEIEIDLWALTDTEIRGEPAKALLASVVEVRQIVKQWVQDFKPGKPEKIEHNAILFYRVKGTGIARDDNSPIKVSVYFFSPDQKTIFVLMYWGSEAAEKQYADELAQIAESVKKP